MIEVNPPDLRLAATCRCPKAQLHIIREGANVRVDWMLGRSEAKEVGAVRDVRNCLRCGAPLRVERADGQQQSAGG